MSAIRTEPRTAMMAVVEVSWEDQFGTRHTSSAKLEDTSPSGACLRVKVPVAVGSAMRVNSYRERFSGTARYCRTDRRDFVVGVQKDKNVNRFLMDVVAPNLSPTVPARNVPIAAAREEVREEIREEVRDTPREENRQRLESPRESQNPAASAVRARPSIAVMPSRDAVSVMNNSSATQTIFNRQLSQNESTDSSRTGSIPVSIASIRKSKGKGKHAKQMVRPRTLAPEASRKRKRRFSRRRARHAWL